MKNASKKTIVIIEDNQSDWSYFRNWLSGPKYDIHPGVEEEFLQFREDIARLYGKNNLTSVSDEARIAIQAYLDKNPADLYVVDYQLIVDNNHGHGIRFCDEFIADKNILLTTGTDGKKGRGIINKMKGYCEKKPFTAKRDFLCKQEFDEDDFREEFIKRVGAFFPTGGAVNTDGY
jgi:hypothetical protein